MVVVAAPRGVHLPALPHHALAGAVRALRPVRGLRHRVLATWTSTLTGHPRRVAGAVVVPVVERAVVEVGIGGGSSPQVGRLWTEGGLWTWIGGLTRRQRGRWRRVSCVTRLRK